MRRVWTVVWAITSLLVFGCSPQDEPGPGSAPESAPSHEASSHDASLEYLPWEGGPEYWSQFENATQWSDPSFFPIGIWHNSVSSDAEAQWDKSHGITFYAEMWEGTDFALLERNEMYWVGGKLNDTFDESSPYWPGVSLDDEVDGRYDPSEGIAYQEDLKAQYADSGKFAFANYTQLVIGSDMDVTDQERYVNMPDAVSLDMYWYTIPFCDWRPYRGDLYADPVPESTCRTASSYGKALNGLTIRDEVDGQLQPRWIFVENLNGLSGQDHVAYITGDQIKGAAMNSIINEARGLVWFNQSFTGPCESSAALRDAQVQGADFCGYEQIEAMGEVNTFVHSLAPIINTQSLGWTFGEGLDTMLKFHDGSAYIFAMTDGAAGTRALALPAEITGESAEVVGEDRTISVQDGSFTDDFATESSYHVYKIDL
ncbi:MAG: hypothetical protein GX440_11410 [Propionibacterium sp.]|nr:hypothetical protein [Propionibacterium sp.]